MSVGVWIFFHKLSSVNRCLYIEYDAKHKFCRIRQHASDLLSYGSDLLSSGCAVTFAHRSDACLLPTAYALRTLELARF